jgi:hypothetical protein
MAREFWIRLPISVSTLRAFGMELEAYVPGEDYSLSYRQGYRSGGFPLGHRRKKRKFLGTGEGLTCTGALF